MNISKSSIFSLWLVATLFLCTLTWFAVWMEFKITATPMPILKRQKNCTIVQDKNSVEFYQTKFRNGTCPTVPNGCFNRTATQCLMLGTGDCASRAIWPPMWQKPCPIKPQCKFPQRRKESIMRFRNAPLTSKTVFEWLNMYEPQSLERFEVITTLLQKVFYPVVKWSSHQKMAVDNVHCIICHQNNTLEYLNCVMSEHLHDDVNKAKVFIYPTKDLENDYSLQHMQKEMEFITNSGATTKESICNLEYLIFKKMRRINNMFAITTKSNKVCKLCDFKTNVYDQCQYGSIVYNSTGKCVLQEN